MKYNKSYFDCSADELPKFLQSVVTLKPFYLEPPSPHMRSAAIYVLPSTIGVTQLRYVYNSDGSYETMRDRSSHVKIILEPCGSLVTAYPCWDLYTECKIHIKKIENSRALLRLRCQFRNVLYDYEFNVQAFKQLEYFFEDFILPLYIFLNKRKINFTLWYLIWDSRWTPLESNEWD